MKQLLSVPTGLRSRPASCRFRLFSARRKISGSSSRPSPALPGLARKIALLCCLAAVNTPLVLAQEPLSGSNISWSDLFETQSRHSDDTATLAAAQLDDELVSQLVKPSPTGRRVQKLRISQIAAAEVYIPDSSEAAATVSVIQAELAPLNMNIPSTAELAIAASALMNPSSSLSLGSLEIDDGSSQRGRRAARRLPDASIPVVYAMQPVLVSTSTRSLPARELGQTERLRASYTVPADQGHAQTPATVANTASEIESLQHIGTYSAASDPVVLIKAQLELAEKEPADSHQDSTAEELRAAEEAASGFALEFSKQLLGLFVDGEERPALIAAHDGQEYLLPLVTILDSSGASLDSDVGDGESTEIRVNTPGGPALLMQEDLRLVDGQLMITQSALAQKLLIETRFDQSSFALYLVLPWSLKQQSEYLAFTAPEPDFAPPAASLRNMRADMFLVSNTSGNYMNGDYFFSGNLAGGGWRFRAEQHGDSDTTPSEYYWAKDWGKSMFLAGNSNYSLHPLLPTVEQTGVQYLYSTTPLPTAGGADITSTNGTRRIANGIRDIAGMATPGAVAELRIDGRVETRTRVRLDGSYDFPDVELPTRGYSEIIVHLLDNSTGALIETQDFSRRSGIELLAAGQQTVFTALGQQGNTLDGQRNSLGASSAAQWRYGLSEDLTIELGRQQVGTEVGNEAAVSMALANHWFASLAFADSISRSSLGLDIEGGSDRWNLDVSMREFSLKQVASPAPAIDEDYSLGLAELAQPKLPTASKQWARSLNFRFQLSDNFSLGLVGRDANTSYEQSNFVLPTASWSNRKNLSVSARPNSEGGYRIDSRYSPNTNSSVRYAFEDDSHLIDYRFSGRSGREYYASFSSDDENPGRLETGFVSHFENERFGTLQMGLVNAENGLGYALEWEATFVPGVSSQLRLSKGNRELTLSDADSDLLLQWHVTFDFAVAQRRIVPADSSSAATQSAALTGDLMLGGEKIASSYAIDRIELLVDGDTYTASVQGGRYYIEGLQPGLHKVGIDARYLPMELSPLQGQSFWVRLEKSAATEVPLALEAKYSIAGRVRDSNGVNLPYQRLVILDSDGSPVGEVHSDQFGLYRTNNLAPGSYRVFADRNGDGDAEIEVIITDSYLFEQNLLIPARIGTSSGDS